MMRHLEGLTDLSCPVTPFRTPFQPGRLLQGDDNSDTVLVHKFFKSTEVNSRLTARSESAFTISLNLRGY